MRNARFTGLLPRAVSTNLFPVRAGRALILFSLTTLATACVASSSSAPTFADDAAPAGGSDGGASLVDATVADAANDADAALPDDAKATAPDAALLQDAGTQDAALATACGDWADGYCGLLDACSLTDYPIGAIWNDPVTCNNRLTAQCISSLTAPSVTQTVAATEACGKAMQNVTVTCAAFRAGNLGATCAMNPGAVPNSGACSFDTQCASTFCVVPPNTTCGTCQPKTSVGGACAQGACSSGQACDPKADLCVAIDSVAKGGSCTVSAQCDWINGVACDPSARTCSLQLAFQQYDAGCGAPPDGGSGSTVVCRGSASCSTTIAPGVCTPAVADGMACTTDGGLNCTPPAVCANGVCALPGATGCP